MISINKFKMKKNKDILKRILLISGLLLCFCFSSYGKFASAKDSVTIKNNLRYQVTDTTYPDTSSDRTLDLYLPKNKGDKLPVFVFIHGGGFSGGDKNSTAAFCAKVASYGYAVVSINYRLYLNKHKIVGASCSANMAKGLKNNFHEGLQVAIKTASEDAIFALKWIKENAKLYDFDCNKVAISGGSAGAMTALYTAYIIKDKPLNIKAVVNLWGGLEHPFLIRKQAAPLLTYHGDQDKLIHVNYAYALHKRMNEIKNFQSKITIMSGLGHARYDYITKNKVDEIISFLNTFL